MLSMPFSNGNYDVVVCLGESCVTRLQASVSDAGANEIIASKFYRELFFCTGNCLKHATTTNHQQQREKR